MKIFSLFLKYKQHLIPKTKFLVLNNPKRGLVFLFNNNATEYKNNKFHNFWNDRLSLIYIYTIMQNRDFFLFLIELIILRHINWSHNFTPHYFNIYFLIKFKFYSIIKHFIRILTYYIFFLIEIIYYSIYINTIIINA